MAKKTGERVHTCEEMYALALAKKSVFVKQWNRHCPAGFFCCWQMSLLINWLRRGEFTIYTPTEKSGKMWYDTKSLVKLKRYPWTPITAGQK